MDAANIEQLLVQQGIETDTVSALLEGDVGQGIYHLMIPLISQKEQLQHRGDPDFERSTLYAPAALAVKEALARRGGGESKTSGLPFSVTGAVVNEELLKDLAEGLVELSYPIARFLGLTQADLDTCRGGNETARQLLASKVDEATTIIQAYGEQQAGFIMDLDLHRVPKAELMTVLQKHGNAINTTLSPPNANLVGFAENYRLKQQAPPSMVPPPPVR